MIDMELLKEIADPVSVAEALDMPMKNKGNRVQILCPCHNDRNFGSAFLTETGFHCFACGEHGDIVALVMKVRDCGFSEAANFLVEKFGGAKLYVRGKSDRNAFLRLKPEEREALKFPHTDISIERLRTLNPEAYKKVVRNRAITVREKYIKILNEYCRRDAIHAVDVFKLFGTANSKTYLELSTEVKERIRVCDSILERFE